MGDLTLLIVIWVIFGFVCGSIWSSKGGSFGGGFAWGALLGPLGLAYVGFATPQDHPEPVDDMLD